MNATCPHVGRVQGIIKRFTKQEYATVILGEGIMRKLLVCWDMPRGMDM